MTIARRRQTLDQSPPRTAKRRDAAACQTMPEVRHEIDRIDQLIVELLAERQGYIEAAGRIKPHRSDVRDSDRIEDVVGKVIAEAKKAGLSPEIAEPVWRTLIERCIAHEFQVFDKDLKGK